MCLISVAPRGTKKVSKTVENFIKEGVTSNTDGSGIMYKRHGTDLINIKKGLNGFDDVMEAIENARLTDDDELIIHHRIGTSGLRNSMNTHPFLVSEDIETMKGIEGSWNLPAMAHNGVFGEYTDRNSDYNDTFHFVNKFIAVPELLALLQRDPNKFEAFFRMKLGTNKLAFLFPERDFLLLGNFIQDEGYYHSNYGYKTYVRDVGGSSSNSKKGDSYEKRRGLMGIEYDEAWEDYFEQQDKLAEESKLNKLLNARKFNKPVQDYIKQIKFLHDDIPLTKENYHHFLFTVREKISNSSIETSEVYAIENYDENFQFIYVYAHPKSKLLIQVNKDVFLKKATFHVKEEFEMIYRPMSRLLVHCGRKPSKSLLKKVSKRLNTGWNKNELKFKNFGIFPKKQLLHFNRKYNSGAPIRVAETSDTEVNKELV